VAQRVTVLGCTSSTRATSTRVNTSGPVILGATVRRYDPWRYVSLRISNERIVQARYLDRVEAPEIEYRAELPPHRQIAAWLLGRIESGELAVGQPVPSEKELMDLFGVARTVRRAIAYLRDQAVIRTVPGRGSYVAKRGS
jgi:GntR family transcriptional regulator